MRLVISLAAAGKSHLGRSVHHLRPLQLAWTGVDMWAVVWVQAGCSLGPGPLRAEGWGL